MELLPSLAFMSSASSFFAYGDAWSTILWITSLTFVLFIVAPSVCWAWNRLKKNNRKTRFFYYSIAAVAIIGATWSFLLPIAIDSGFHKDDDGPVLRQILLYATGGLLGVITLGETHRKNNQEKEKNENDHTRQVHSERRTRYAKAIEQLADEKAAIRLGGIYTLVGLVDEWLADDSLDPEEQQKEGQVIINNLCSYIRSPFTLAESRNIIEASIRPGVYSGNLKEDKAKLREEQDVRRAIFDEMEKRSSEISKDNNKNITVTPGVWSNFDFDFNQAPIFYSLSNLTIERANFNLANFYGDAEFYNVTFVQDADFILATFTCDADFRKATFIQDADFRKADFTRDADFEGADFICDADFSEATFSISVNFTKTTFIHDANFSKTIFVQDALFLGTTFHQNVSFSEATFKTYMPFFAQWGEVRARFSIYADSQKHNFKTRQGSQPIPRNQPIPLGKAELEGVEHIIPVGAVLFNPNSRDDKTQDYTISEPAKPFENSDTEEEKPAE